MLLSTPLLLPRNVGRLIALIENDAVTRRLMVIQLHTLGFRVIAASSMNEVKVDLQSDGAAAVPELLITDLHLRDADGLEQVIEIRTWPGYAHLPVLLLTGDIEVLVARRAAQLAVSIAYKPVTAGRLLGDVLRALRCARDDPRLQ